LIPFLGDGYKNEYIDATNLYVRDLPYSYDILVENLCDPSHISFAHHSFMNGADRYQESDDSYRLDLKLVSSKTSENGFVAIKDNPPVPEGNGEYKIEFKPPCL